MGFNSGFKGLTYSVTVLLVLGRCEDENVRTERSECRAAFMFRQQRVEWGNADDQHLVCTPAVEVWKLDVTCWAVRPLEREQTE